MLPETPEHMPAQTEDRKKDFQVTSIQEGVNDRMEMNILLGRTGSERRYDTPGSGFPSRSTVAPLPLDEDPDAEILFTMTFDADTGKLKIIPALPLQ